LERYLGVLKGYVRNRAHPEGSIMEGERELGLHLFPN
jgi:hypothetical protein